MNETELRDMVGFLTYAMKQDMKCGQILTTVTHNLAELLKGKPGFSPRTQGYGIYCQI